MCGIAGIVSPRLSVADREERVLEMISRQRHRGPDDTGLVSHSQATLGMCRLAIFDPANGRQPMSTVDGRFHIVFNGAIYNHRELRDELKSIGWEFRTHCDTEVLLASFAQWGEACLPRLRGMFGFAIWDSRDRSLFGARGPFGIKPFYYARLPDETFVFASELNGLLASGLIPIEIDPIAVGDYLAWFAIPAPRTIYRRVINLPPGHSVKVDANSRCRTSLWWKLPETKEAEGISQIKRRESKSLNISRQSSTYREFIRELRGRLEDTIRAHQLADVPVGAFLSGGLDSAVVVALMASTGAAKMKTFSLIFDETEYSEQATAAKTALALGSEHHEMVLTGKRVAEDLPKLLNTLDQPTGDGINTYYVSQAAHEGGVRVALSGLGGDELFGGYPSFRDMPRLARIIPLWRQMPTDLRNILVAWLRKGNARKKKLADILDYARDLHELCSLRRRVLPEQTRLGLLAPEARRLAQRQGANHPMLDEFIFELTGADDFQICSAWEMRTYMADVLLRDSDVFSMAHSLELRVPFVDKVFVDWWWNQPQAFKWEPLRPKSALIDAVADLLPVEVLQRRKQSFTLPLARWMQAELKPFLEEIFSEQSLAACPWLDCTATQAEWGRFSKGNDSGNWGRVWTLAMLIGFVRRGTVNTGCMGKRARQTVDLRV
jgi:asparagine synthase (glutamine-hydrolysing)